MIQHRPPDFRYREIWKQNMMEVHFTPEQEAQLARIARRDGKGDAVELLKSAGLRILEEDAQFRAAVMEGKAFADGGDFIEEEEMDARFEEMLRS